MYGVVICVVLVIVGNVNSFGISRTRRGLEQTILDVFGSPSEQKQMDHHQRPRHQLPLKPDHDAVKEEVKKDKVFISQGILDNIFGPPATKSNPDAESSVPHFFSAIITDVKNTEQEEERDVANIFGTPPPPAIGAVTPTQNSTTTNQTGIFEFDDRFLSESLLRQQWTLNRENIEKDTEKHIEKPHAPGKERGTLEPGPFKDRRDPLPLEPTSSVPRHSDSGPLEPRGLKPKPLEPAVLEPTPSYSKPLEPNHSEPKNQTPKSTSPNASSHIVSNSLVLLLVYFCLESIV